MNEPNKGRMIPLHLADQAVAACNKEIAELRAQVAELKQQPDALTAYLYAAELAKDDIKKLKAENERLRAAGDAMAARLLYQGYPETVQAWEAAKKL
jgi:predicted ester cyclase